jgi:hypothetical protein
LSSGPLDFCSFHCMMNLDDGVRVWKANRILSCASYSEAR